jgi:hypothetical protein
MHTAPPGKHGAVPFGDQLTDPEGTSALSRYIWDGLRGSEEAPSQLVHCNSNELPHPIELPQAIELPNRAD